MTHIIIRNARIIDPAQNIDSIGDLEIKKGVISGIGGQYKSSSDTTEIDASNKWIVPGLVDMHTHLREPGREDKETIQSGTAAAAAGGFTSIACMANTMPINDNQAITRFILERSQKAKARVYPIAAITRGLQGSDLTDMGELVRAGAVAFSDDGVAVRNADVLRRALEYAKMFSKTLIEHCEDPDLAAGGAMHEGLVSARLGLPSIPSIAEEIIVSRDIQLAEYTGGRIHIAHVSTENSVQLIREAKKRGTPVTAEATPHHLFLTDEAVSSFDANFKMSPPLRSEKDRQALISGVLDGTIDCIASDHAPHTVVEKEVEFGMAPNGVVGLETALPIVLTKLVHTRKMSVLKMVELMSSAPCRILGIPGGHLKVGGVADVTLIDPEKYTIIDPMQFRSLSRNTPFKGWTMRGAAEMTIVDGRLVESL